MKRGRWQGLLDKPGLSGKAKVHDVRIDQNLKLDATGVGTDVVILANPISQGTGETQRVGNIVRLKSAQLNLVYTPSGFNQPEMDITRVALVYDRQPTGNYPTYTDIFKGAASASTDSFCFPNVDNDHRFIIIRDYLHQLPQQVAPITASARCVLGSIKMGGRHNNVMEDFIDLTGLSTVFSGTATPLTPAQITTGALYIVLQGLYAYPTNAWTAEIHLRLRYDE